MGLLYFLAVVAGTFLFGGLAIMVKRRYWGST